MTLQFLHVPSSEQQTPNIRMPISDKPIQPGTPSLTLNWQVLCFLSRECTYPSSVSHLQMFFICPLLQHLLGCPDMLRSPKSWEKKSLPSQAPQRLLPSEPALEHLYCRKTETATWGNEINPIKLSTGNFPPSDLFFFLLISSTSFIILHLSYSPSVVCPGLTTLVYWISP